MHANVQLGQIVMYTNIDKQRCPAIVTEIDERSTQSQVYLTIFNRYGTQPVPAVPFSEKSEPGTWNYLQTAQQTQTARS